MSNREARRRCRAGAICESLGGPFWVVVAIGAVFTLARFSEAFLVVRASEMGLVAELDAARAGGDESHVRCVGVSGRAGCRIELAAWDC